MSIFWAESDGLDRTRRLIESLPDPESVNRYLAMPHSYVCERLAEAGATEAVHLREIQRLREQGRARGLDLLRKDLRIAELEQALEKPARKSWSVPEWVQIAVIAMVGPFSIYLIVQFWARLCVWLAGWFQA